MLKKISSCFAVLLVACATVIAGDVDLEGVKCVVANRDAKEANSAKFKGSTVYFCCGNCKAKFTENKKDFAEKANHQLVATKQFEQKNCPLSGGKLNPETAVKVAGVPVAFCCNNCKGKVEGADDDAAKVKMVFADKAFEKGFKKTAKQEAK